MFLDKCKTCLAHFLICDTSFFNDSLSFLHPSRLVIQSFNLEYRNLIGTFILRLCCVCI